MMPERVGIEMRDLPYWRAFLERKAQSLQRTIEFRSQGAAMFFAGTLGDICDEHPDLPRIVVQPGGAPERPARMTVTIGAPELEMEHFALARFIDATLALMTPAAGEPDDTVSLDETVSLDGEPDETM